MCGICGFYSPHGEPVVEKKILRNMLQVIRHRGPDDEGMYLESRLAMGMRRLSIIDLAGGTQPITNEDGSVVVVFNGEIYNYHDLRASLRAKGHRFATASDTEVIVHLYEDKGDDCVHSLRGMFAFAVWDVKKRRLLLARDRLGIKPLYYAHAGNTLVFGSEIKAILQHPDVAPRLDPSALSHYLSLKYVPAPQTMFAGITALPPGHTLVCDANDRARVQRYWSLSFAKNGGKERSEPEYAEQLEWHLRDSVKSHLLSDVPFGAFLSGGVDSSTIVALMSQTLGRDVKTFAVGFEGDGQVYSEGPYARLVADQYHTDHEEVLVRPADLTDLAEQVIWHLDQPIADNACVANYILAERASRQVKMVLTGEGGDELFAGYARYAGEQFSPYLKHVPPVFRSAVLRCGNAIPGLRRQKIALFALCQQDEVTRYVNWFPLFNSAVKQNLLSEEFARETDALSANEVFARHLVGTDATAPVDRMLSVDTALWLPDDLLARGDKMSMAASLEARVPLLDHKLVEFAASLPPHLKLRGLTRKYLLKKVASQWIPERIITRKKEGFPMPFSIWFRKQAKPFVRDLLSPDTIRRRGLLNASFVDRLLTEHESGTADHGSLLWGLLSVELWHRAFIDSRQPAPAREQATAYPNAVHAAAASLNRRN